MVDTTVPFQEPSKEIWASKYQLKDKAGNPVDQTIEDTYKRVAQALADVENTDQQGGQYENFLWALKNGAIPAGRIMSNAGAQAYKPATSLINCTVSQTVHDSMTDILDSVHQAGLTLKAGCGIGYEFSTLRPKGSWVSGAGASTSGPLSFMDIFDRMCATVSSAGGRRGAQMATFDIHHPDVMEFIQAKREDGRLRQFNCSLLITDLFMDAVINGKDWVLSFPVTGKEVEEDGLDLTNPEQVVYRDFPVTEGYITNNAGQVACKVYDKLPAQQIWDTIMKSTYDYAEPGFILIDQVNEMNNNWFCEEIRATNPCGEQPLPPEGACLLGSINLTKFVEAPFTDKASFNFEKFAKVVRIFTRMLDNVVEIHGLPLEGQAKEIAAKRRHGMGFLGLGSALSMLGVAYGSDEACNMTSEIARTLAVEGWKEALNLAKEKGPAPIMEQEFEITPKMLARRPEMAKDGIQVGDKVPGRVLHARYSRYMQKIAKVDPQLVAELEQVGARFTHHSSIAPTGTISLSLGNNASNGIEPSFSHSYLRNVIREGKKTKEQVEVASFELLTYRHFINPEATDKDLPASCVTADTISPVEHIAMQAAAQEWIDSSISKTANVPTEMPFENFKDLYLTAYKARLKGCTTFRFNPEAFQGVLVRKEDLENTTYVFTLEDGSQVELKGNESVMYEGEEHTAANLYDALKEGTYGAAA
ncbi:adenosylcobalamin-dependent ribonucleoside-diphosphate reductase [Marinobacter sp. P4B1]|uniref:adenosylcobalamin-dependent ribonucleoside-diphosphate reductase n=1 Tax=Marinobacter sp. P4B1 TaxID=1119533 RepID=UPI00071D5F25|nr:adenosylcobalamin-dependent ribonucleoside-diphosphate reductase [Marinobacter sp. P4B1]KRW83708.1 NrdJa [Marinobacter sp. P4B1]